METTAPYIVHPQTKYAPGDDFFCKCGKILGHIVEVKWWNNRRNTWRRSQYLVCGRVKVYGRGEVTCSCGERTVWSG